MAKYTAHEAAAKARQIFDRFGSRIAEVCAGSPVTEDFLGGFVGVEAGVDHHGQINENAVRFEPGVFHHLSLVRAGYASSWSKITTADLKGATDDALRNLATSYGLTQIMGWHMIHDLAGSIADLRDSEKHLHYAVQLLVIDGGSWLRRKNWDAVLHIWNSGSPTGRTYDPDYVHNALAVKAAYAALLQQSAEADGASSAPGADEGVRVPSDSAADSAQADDAQSTAGSGQPAPIPEQPPIPDQSGVVSQGSALSTAGNKFDDIAGKASVWQGRSDSVKAMWAAITHLAFQPVWAVLSLKVLGLPFYAWLGVSVLVFLTWAGYHWRQMILGKIREWAAAAAAKPQGA